MKENSESDFLAQYVWRTWSWIESTGGAQAKPRNQQTSKPTTDEQQTKIKTFESETNSTKWG